MMAVLQAAETLEDRKLAFDIHIMVLLEVVKLISHADTSSGAATDVVNSCADTIEELCKTDEGVNEKHFFDTIVKTAKNKALKEWPDCGYDLLKSTVYLVRNRKQADKVYEIFPILGPLYNGKEYPETYLITLGITERLEGMEAAERYLMDHLDVKEVRVIAVDKALEAKSYSLAERLCVEALNNDDRKFGKAPVWTYYLERIYEETSNSNKQMETVREILFRGDTKYYSKLKELFHSHGLWDDQRKEALLHELSKALMVHDYIELLSRADELRQLLEAIRRNPYYIVHYGKQLAAHYSEEAYGIYEEWIWNQAKEATDRGKYKAVCHSIKSLWTAGGRMEALKLIDRLNEAYPRRPAMQDELAGLRKKLK
jgi:hypothetical protein